MLAGFMVWLQLLLALGRTKLGQMNGFRCPEQNRFIIVSVAECRDSGLHPGCLAEDAKTALCLCSTPGRRHQFPRVLSAQLRWF